MLNDVSCSHTLIHARPTKQRHSPPDEDISSHFVCYLPWRIPCLSALAAAALSFSTMEDGDRVEITYSSKGCFHDETLYYEVRRRDGLSVFIQYAITWEKGIQLKISEKKVLGELKLTNSDVAGLDGLLRFYRGKKESNSTTEDSMLVEYFEGAKQVGIKKLHDESGGYGLDTRKDVVRLFQLAARFQK